MHIFATMVESIGLDIIELARIKGAFDRHGKRFLRRTLSESEARRLESRRDSIPYLAGRFAAKEAVMKALGAVFDSGVYLKDIQIENDSHGKPFVELPERLSAELGSRRILLSISHSKTTAAAVAIIDNS